MGDSPRAPGFGEIELDLGWDEGSSPASSDQSRVHTRITRRAFELPVLDRDDADIPADELETLARDFRTLRPTSPPPSESEAALPPSGDGPDSAVDAINWSPTALAILGSEIGVIVVAFLVLLWIAGREPEVV